jgi:hypothetical protein
MEAAFFFNIKEVSNARSLFEKAAVTVSSHARSGCRNHVTLDDRYAIRLSRFETMTNVKRMR